MSESEGDTYLLHLLGVLRRRWLVVLVCAVVAPGVALAISLDKPKQYEAKAQLLFQDPRFEQAIFGTSPAPAVEPSRQAATNLKLVDLEAVSKRTGRKLGVSPGEVRDAITVAPEGNANLIGITASWGNGVYAARLADTYAHQYIAFRRTSQRGQLRNAQRVVEQQLTLLTPEQRLADEGKTLEDRANQLRILAALQTGDAELVSPAGVPTAASSPRPKRDALLGFALGLMLGLGLALLIDRLDRRLRGADDVGRALRAPVLGSVPLGRGLTAGGSLESGTADVFRALHANVHYVDERSDLRSLLFTSLGTGDGRSQVAWHFAAAAAESGQRVLVIHADLRSPSAEPGLTSVLAQGATLSEVVTTTATEAGVLDSLPAGPAVEAPMSLLAGPRVAELLELTQLSYDLVVIDAPPLGSAPDGIPLAKSADGVIVVVRTGTHSARALRSLRAELERLGIRVVGAVLTGTRRSAKRHDTVDLSPALDPS
jgi:polysaccharide biosynthesis transport protein